jgi:hypothetical protein
MGAGPGKFPHPFCTQSRCRSRHRRLPRAVGSTTLLPCRRHDARMASRFSVQRVFACHGEAPPTS